MKKSTMWIIGIAIGLVCVVALAAAGYFIFSWWNGAGGMMGGVQGYRAWGDGRASPWHTMPMHPDRGMPYSRFSGFYPLMMAATGFICLGLLALIGLGGFALVRGLSRPSQPAEQPVAPPVPSQSCSNCGRPVQEDWSHCPYCGNHLSENPESEIAQT